VTDRAAQGLRACRRQSRRAESRPVEMTDKDTASQRTNVEVFLRTRPTPNFAADCLKAGSRDFSSKTAPPACPRRRRSARQPLPAAPHSQVLESRDEFEVTSSRAPVGTDRTIQDDARTAHVFRFAGLLHEASQEDVFDATCGDIVTDFCSGINGTVLAYGQTGAGKTHTMLGGRGSYAQRGLVPRALTRIFETLAVNGGGRLHEVRLSYCEIYNDRLYDLLDPSRDPASIGVADAPGGGVVVRGLTASPASSEAEALQLMFEGEENRAIGEHQLNVRSSRSHAVLTVYLRTRQSPDDPSFVASKLHLVDLAGSERLRKTGSDGATAKEAAHINASLSFLEQVVVALGQRGREHVPFRSSRLTHLLKDSLGGNARTRMVACVWGERQHLDETLSTCRFAQRMAGVQNEYRTNVGDDSGGAAAQALQRRVRQLEEELALYDSLAAERNAEDGRYNPYSSEQRSALREQALAFLERPLPGAGDALDPLEMLSARHVREALLACRVLWQERGAAGASGTGGAGGWGAPTAAASIDEVDESRPTTAGPRDTGMKKPGFATRPATPPEGGVGKAAADGGLGAAVLGMALTPGGGGDAVGSGGTLPDDVDPALIAPADAAPSVPPLCGVGSAGASRSSGTPSGAPGDHPAATVAGAAAPLTQAEALAEFKRGPGADLASALTENREALRRAKKRVRAEAEAVNGAKRAIDEARARAATLAAEREAARAVDPTVGLGGALASMALAPRAGDDGDGDGGVTTPTATSPAPDGESAAEEIGEAEYEALMAARAAKIAYREAFRRLEAARSEEGYVSGLARQCSRELAESFDAWDRDRRMALGEGPSGGGSGWERHLPAIDADRDGLSSRASSRPGGGGGGAAAAGAARRMAAARVAAARGSAGGGSRPSTRGGRGGGPPRIPSAKRAPSDPPPEELADPAAAAFWASRKAAEERGMGTTFYQKASDWGKY